MHLILATALESAPGGLARLCMPASCETDQVHRASVALQLPCPCSLLVLHHRPSQALPPQQAHIHPCGLAGLKPEAHSRCPWRLR